MEVQPDNYGEWLSDCGRWDWWFTGTFEYDAPMATARHAMDHLLDKFNPDRAFYAIESTERWWSVDCGGEGEQVSTEGSNVHVHAVIEVGEDGPSPHDGEDFWEARFGWALVEEYDPDEGCAHYVTKYATKDLLGDRSSWNVYTSDGEGWDDVPF
ncbi:hypothetical protein GGQ13_003104 [Salinibacter ruber]|jgi:hypothetical protein|uniref:hypothetical protein n=1 Tax=Salinibacter ruber TaxID=146919 RepID=UPI0021697559|nr:hypothetical protein [Salinibacter ruber]MCS3616964.1 hypothetical protein [Salinibacter ruber]MCS4139648.1 hypothetical protein [Salinibacter ruber]